MNKERIFEEAEMTDKERADRLEAMIDRMAGTISTLRGELLAANDLLRTTNSIVTRRGKDTNWIAFGKQVEIALERQRPILFK